MTEKKENKIEKALKRSPWIVEVGKRVFFLLVGVVLIVQPWLKPVSWVGWFIVALSLLVGVMMIVRYAKAGKMRKALVAEFACGDAVYEKGMLVNGTLYDFSTFGAEKEAAAFDGEKLRVKYSFYARRGGRTGEVLEIPVGAEEAEKAQVVLEKLGLPEFKEETSSVSLDG